MKRVDYRILFADESEQIAFVRNGVARRSGAALKNVLLARKVLLSVLSRSMGSQRFQQEFRDLETHPLFSKPGQDLAVTVQQVENECRQKWGSDLRVALGSPSSKQMGELLYFNLVESDHWDLSCFHEGSIDDVMAVTQRRQSSSSPVYRLELDMSPFGFPAEDYKVNGCSWMLPLALACHNKQRGIVTRGDTVFSGCLEANGELKADRASSIAKWQACQLMEVKTLVLPHVVYGGRHDQVVVDEFSKALSLNESINIFSIEGKTDRQVVSTLRQSSVSQRDWKRILPVAKLFHQKLIEDNLRESFPATFDYAKRLLASSLLHTGHAREAHALLQEILQSLKDKDVSSYLHLDIFENGDVWLRYAFDYFFTESTVLSKLGMLEEALYAIDERLRDLENTERLMKKSLGFSSSSRLDYSWVKGLFTKVICLVEHGLCLGEVSSLQYAWELCQSPRYLKFFENYLGCPEDELPSYLTVEAVIRSFNYTVDVAFELHQLDMLASTDLNVLNMTRQRVLEHWGEQPHDMFFGLSCLKIDNMLKRLDGERQKHYKEFFWKFRDSSFYSVADKVMERLNLNGQEKIDKNQKQKEERKQETPTQ